MKCKHGKHWGRESCYDCLQDKYRELVTENDLLNENQRLKEKVKLYEGVMGKDPLSQISAESHNTIVSKLKAEIERLKKIEEHYKSQGNDIYVRLKKISEALKGRDNE